MTEIWGPCLWKLIHILSDTFKSESQKTFFKILFKKYILLCIPCNECMLEYKNFIYNNDFNYSTFKKDLLKFHEDISNKIGKDMEYYNYNNYLNSYQFSNDVLADTLLEIYFIFKREELDNFNEIKKLIKFLNYNIKIINCY